MACQAQQARHGTASLNLIILWDCVSFRVMEWTLPKYSESHGMSSLFRGITKTVPSQFRGIFSERNFDGNPISDCSLCKRNFDDRPIVEGKKFKLIHLQTESNALTGLTEVPIWANSPRYLCEKDQGEQKYSCLKQMNHVLFLCSISEPKLVSF
jgi:hypothetical protein